MLGTPFITFLRPSSLEGYNNELPFDQQPSTVPKTFLDAMEVRKEVFVKEQGVPLTNEFDSDDPRACHWVVYASVTATTEPEVKDDAGNIIRRKESAAQSQQIGTIRLVPFPHPPHPEPGSSFAADALEMSPDPSKPPPYIVDRVTTYHDGNEPYIKLGRIAVVEEFRGCGIANLLVSTAITWAQQNPTYFNPSVKSIGREQMGAVSTKEIPVWKGLMCVHAQEQVARAWAKWGFKIDEGMGTWDEEGIKHVGMFQRLKLENQVLKVD